MSNTILIKLNQYDEYEVPTDSTRHIYYTDDKEDAIATARRFNSGAIRIVRGSYNVEG